MVRLNPHLLDQARTTLGLSSDEKLAAHLGLSRNTIHGLRHGRTAPSAATLLKLSRATSIPMEEWLVEENTDPCPVQDPVTLRNVREVLARLEREARNVEVSNPVAMPDEYASGYLAGIVTAHQWIKNALGDTP